MNFPPATLPWYRSKVIVGAIVSILAKLLVGFGVIGELAPGDEDIIAEALVTVIGAIGDVVVIGSRVRQKHAPEITAT